jgi:hypothetical protein
MPTDDLQRAKAESHGLRHGLPCDAVDATTLRPLLPPQLRGRRAALLRVRASKHALPADAIPEPRTLLLSSLRVFLRVLCDSAFSARFKLRNVTGVQSGDSRRPG